MPFSHQGKPLTCCTYPDEMTFDMNRKVVHKFFNEKITAQITPMRISCLKPPSPNMIH